LMFHLWIVATGIIFLPDGECLYEDFMFIWRLGQGEDSCGGAEQQRALRWPVRRRLRVATTWHRSSRWPVSPPWTTSPQALSGLLLAELYLLARAMCIEFSWWNDQLSMTS
jgi:hypothetical protein